MFLLLIILPTLLYSCSLIDKNKYSPVKKNDQHVVKQKEYEKLVDSIPYKKNEPFNIVHTDTPCWLTSPKNCHEYINDNNIYMTCKIMTEKIREEGTDDQKKEIDACFYSKFTQLLRNEYNKKMGDISECYSKKNLCEENFEKFFNSPNMNTLKNNFEHKKYYWININNDQWEFYVLGLITQDYESLLKQQFVEFIKNNLPKNYVPLNNPPIIWYE